MISVEVNAVNERDSWRVTRIYLADGDTDREPAVAVMIKFCGFAYTLGDFVSR
jgi:hypothetical protein